jgi:hypothetical protein
MIPSHVPPTTHTLEMAQIAELNQRLSSHTGLSAITAAAIGMGGVRLLPAAAGELPDQAVLVRVSWQGSPEFPDIHGHFAGGQVDQPFCAVLHTAALIQLSHQLGVRQRWGI